MYKIAILGCENSHANAFLKLIKETEEYSCIDVVGIYSDEQEPVDKLVEAYGVKAMENYDSLVGQLDGLVITARHGDNHYKYAKPYIKDGIPMFIDKPITVSEEDAVAFMKELCENNIKVCGGSSCVFFDEVAELKKLVEQKPHGEVLAGNVRAPIDLNNNYGGFFFYSQHLAQMMTEIFGCYPESATAVRTEKGVDALINYGGFEVTANYTAGNWKYGVGANFESEVFAKLCVAPTAGLYGIEFAEFFDILTGKEQKMSYNDFIAPVFILNAINRSLETGKTEKINRAPEIK